MANHVSALKRVRMTERQTVINNARRSRLRTGLKALRRLMEAKDANAASAIVPQTFSIVDRAAKWGVKDLNRKYNLQDMVSGDVIFAATGVTDGSMLEGVRLIPGGYTTETIVMRSWSQTIRTIKTQHRGKR